MAFLHSPLPPQKIERRKEWLRDASKLLKIPESDPRWSVASQYLRGLLFDCEWQLSARSRAGSLSKAVDDLRRITNAADGLHAALREACFSARALLEPEHPHPGWPLAEYSPELKQLWEAADGADLPSVVIAHCTWKFGAAKELPSKWETRAESLATVTRAVADHFDKQDAGGVRDLFSGASGSFDLWLMGECARALARFGLRVGQGSIRKLARLISSFVREEEPTPEWGVEPARRAAAWWRAYGPHAQETLFAQQDRENPNRLVEGEPVSEEARRLGAMTVDEFLAYLEEMERVEPSSSPEMVELAKGPQALPWNTQRGRKTKR